MGAEREHRGVPIAAHLALLVALAFAAAYVVNLAVVLVLPPRPPDVVRADVLMDTFEAGYEAAKADARLPRPRGVRFAIQTERPQTSGEMRAGRIVSRQLAERLQISPDQIAIASQSAPSDMFVFRVGEVDVRRVRTFELSASTTRHVEQQLSAAHRAEIEALRATQGPPRVVTVIGPEGQEVRREILLQPRRAAPIRVQFKAKPRRLPRPRRRSRRSLRPRRPALCCSRGSSSARRCRTGAGW